MKRFLQRKAQKTKCLKIFPKSGWKELLKSAAQQMGFSLMAKRIIVSKFLFLRNRFIIETLAQRQFTVVFITKILLG